MAYTHSKQEFLFQTGSGPVYTATTSGDKGFWSPMYVPHYVRAVSVMTVNSGAVMSTLKVLFNHISMASGSTASAIDQINGTSTHAAGQVLYIDGLNVKVSPGERVNMNVTQIVSGTCNFMSSIYIEPCWEQPGNDTTMVTAT